MYLIIPPNRGIRNWDDAVTFCRRRSARIAKIDSASEWNALYDILKCENDKGDGWYIGGKARNGKWYWEDGSYMAYKNFAPNFQLFPQEATTRTVYNYAFVPSLGRYWKYVSPRSSNILGVICEKTC
ncbi:uncharacterized protein LOC133190063 [Saccostrea echinata]|uniref:uncharacterized protein LOC133190063 n=1 Tax=Saccostrea echinata TaxID=191078 RepID=UPI002A8378F2|nr:uncharacterized protein LOC133190063 [Saccostrea echinata]